MVYSVNGNGMDEELTQNVIILETGKVCDEFVRVVNTSPF